MPAVIGISYPFSTEPLFQGWHIVMCHFTNPMTYMLEIKKQNVLLLVKTGYGTLRSHLCSAVEIKRCKLSYSKNILEIILTQCIAHDGSEKDNHY